jgi:hypothetical protein
VGERVREGKGGGYGDGGRKKLRNRGGKQIGIGGGGRIWVLRGREKEKRREGKGNGWEGDQVTGEGERDNGRWGEEVGTAGSGEGCG